MAKRREPDAGQYDKYMILQEMTETNTQGSVAVAPSDLADMWCSLRPLAGREYYDSMQVQAEVTHKARTWWRDDVTPTAAMRLYCPDESRTFEIAGVIDVEERHEEFEFRLVETS